MKSRFLVTLAVALAAVGVGVVILFGGVSGGSEEPPRGMITTIYSDNFTPVVPNDPALTNLRYYDHPGSAPNLYQPGGMDYGRNAFINSPDLTLGHVAMSAVSAEVCLELNLAETPKNQHVWLLFGVQDKDRKVIFWEDEVGCFGFEKCPWREVTPTVPAGSQQCETLTFPQAVKLVNHPHLVVAVDLKLQPESRVAVDGVTYTLRNTQPGDIAPSELWPYAE